MKLRNWQSECVSSAIEKYKSFKKHFLGLATPGAGKTYMASVLAKKMHEQDLIDLVICFSPSSVVSSDFSDALVEQFGTHFDGTIGALGDSFTYQKLNSIPEQTWRLLDRYRVFVIFDEIHHCAGSSEHDANSWGAPIINKIRDKAEYTIALTGTPWRSDSLPIALSEYCEQSGKVLCDYIYGLKEAVRDDVCRIPQIIAVDNDKITITGNQEQQNFQSFSELLSQNIIPYTQLVKNELVVEQLLLRAINKLDEIRVINHNAGGLVVASSIEHACSIKNKMKALFSTDAIIVTSNEKKPSAIIKQFRKSKDKWLISVGMVSEGTNIPRLQVCCNLSNVKTEMYFRQILGRILRKTQSKNQDAFMFIPAEPNLLDYAFRVAQDIPDGLSKVILTTMNEELNADISETENDEDSELTDLSVKAPECVNLDVSVQYNQKVEEDILTAREATLEKKVHDMEIEGIFSHEELEVADLGMYQISDTSMQKLSELNNASFH